MLEGLLFLQLLIQKLVQCLFNLMIYVIILISNCDNIKVHNFSSDKHM